MVSLKKNAFFNIIKTVLSVALPLATFPYVSRILLPSNIGKVNFATTFIEYFALIASLGISTYAIRVCSSVRENRQELSKVASEIFSINVFTSILSYVLLAVILVFFRKLDNYRVLIIIQSFSIVLTTFGADWLNQAMEDFQFITLRTIISQIFYLICIFIFIKSSDDYIKYAIISLCTSSGCYIVNIFYRKRYCDIGFTANINWNKHFKPIMQLFIMQLAQVVVTSTDSTMLGLIRNEYEVGIYSFAMSITNMISQVTGSILWVMLPRLSYLFSKNNYEEINALLSDVFGFFMVLGLPCMVGIISLSDDIVLLVAGSAYAESSIVLMILMFSFLLSLLGDSFLGNMVLLPSGRENTYMKVTVIAAIFNVIVNYILISKYGFIGAAITAVLTSLLTTILIVVWKDKQIQIDSLFKRAISPIIGCIAIYVICFISKQFINNYLIRLAIAIPTSIVVYFLILLIMKNDALMSVLKGSLPFIQKKN